MKNEEWIHDFRSNYKITSLANQLVNLEVIWKPFALNLVENILLEALVGQRILVLGYRAQAFACLLQEDYGADCYVHHFAPGINHEHSHDALGKQSHLLPFPKRITSSLTNGYREWFDIIISVSDLSTKGDVSGYMKVLNRLTRPGGTIVIADYFNHGMTLLSSHYASRQALCLGHYFRSRQSVFQQVDDGLLDVLSCHEASNDTKALLELKRTPRELPDQNGRHNQSATEWLRDQLHSGTLTAEILIFSSLGTRPESGMSCYTV